MALLSSTKDSDGTEHIKVAGSVQLRKPEKAVSEAGEAPERAQPVILDDYLHTTHPETGLEVVYVPGDAKPEWLVDQEAKPATERPQTRHKGKGSVAAAETRAVTDV